MLNLLAQSHVFNVGVISVLFHVTVGSSPLIERDIEACLYQRPGMKRTVKAQLPDRSNFPWLIKYSNPAADLRASLVVNTKDGHRCTLLVPCLSYFRSMEQLDTSKADV